MNAFPLKIKRTPATTHKPRLDRKYSAPALEKGLDILELFAREPGGMIKSEVARKLHRTTSEVFRMLVCLQDRGYITQGEDEQFRLTLRLFELGQQHPPTKRLIAEALPLMHDVAHLTNQSCHLATVDDGVIVILAQVDAPSSTGFFTKPGHQVNLMAGASGYVVLAHQSEAVQAKSVELHRRRGGEVPDDFSGHIERVRQQGYEVRASYQVKGVVNISFPILDSHGSAIAALTVPFLQRIEEKTSEQEVVDALRAASAQLSTQMGYKPEETASHMAAE